MKVIRSSNNELEYWIHIPKEQSEARIIIEAKNWKESDKIVKKLFREIRKKKMRLT